MRISWVLFIKQGWYGLPLFFLGLGSLAFSQLEDNPERKDLSGDELASSVSSGFKRASKILESLDNQVQSNLADEIASLESQISYASPSNEEADSLKESLNVLRNRYTDRSQSISDSFSMSSERLNDLKEIFSDINRNFAGRMEEAKPALLALSENLAGSIVELEALATMASGLSKDFTYETASLRNQLSVKSDRPNLAPPSDNVPPQPTTSLGKKISSIIHGNEDLSQLKSSSLRNQVNVSKSAEFSGSSTQSLPDEDGIIAQLRKELNDSKSFQTELSADSSELKSDLRKAYREIVSLQTNLKESQLIINELEKYRKSAPSSYEGNTNISQNTGREINRLEKELEQAREDLRQSRQSLLLEQQRSNAIITSITTELDRTRRDLDNARHMANSNGASFERLSYLENELAVAKSALQRTQAEPIQPGTDEFFDLQEELKKSLAEIARMQIELSEKDQLQEELLRVKNSMEQMADLPSRSASPTYVNKLLTELNAANAEVEKLKKGNRLDRDDISVDMIALQDELQATQTQLEQVRNEFANTKENIAKREFEFATTIKRLEEEAQKAESILQQAAEGKIPVVPFVSEMEEDLAASESRIRLLSDQFANEQKKATEVIEQLNEELELAQARHKQSLDQLSRRELELTDKGQEVDALLQEKKELEEELEVVKVIAGQLQDLNQVLEETKESQVTQSKSSDQVLDSLRKELNRSKVELVVALDEKDKIQADFSSRIKNLEIQLEDAQNELIEEQDLFQEVTSESKILVSQLKTELDAARKEIATMKTVGVTDSLETRQAVAQLQEALGTIRILQESLQEAEESNLEVDNLRTELADVMSGQLEKFNAVEREKEQLSTQIQNLEAEIAILRTQNSGNQLIEHKSIAELQSKLSSSKEEISRLKKNLRESEEHGVGSLVLMEDELAVLRNENDDLKSSLQLKMGSDSETIRSLENELEIARKSLNDLSSQNNSNSDWDALKAENENLLQKIQTLTNQEIPQTQPSDVELSNMDEDLIEKAMDLEMKLELALSKIEKMESAPKTSNNSDIELLQQELAQANSTIDELNSQIESMISKQAEAELELAMLENSPTLEPDPINSDDQHAILLQEINTLKEELESAKLEYNQRSSKSPDIASLQEELKTAIADSFELQMQLELTQSRLKKMEEVSSLNPTTKSIAEISRQADEAQSMAQARIDELTNALRNSESLRAETEDLVTALEQKATRGNDISQDPRFIELQQEMLALQNDLISLQEMGDPRVKELEEQLNNSRNQSARINGELQDFMNQFANLKGSLDGLEDENRKLREISLTNARNEANEAGDQMQREILKLSRENANLSNQISEKDARIDGLRDELAQLPKTNQDQSSRNQILQLKMQLESAEDASSQAKMEAQRIRAELDFANRSLSNLQSRIRDFENSTTQEPRVNPLQLSELEDLKSQNAMLKDQIAQMSPMAASEELRARVKDLNQRNLNLTVELDQERIIIDDLKNELSNARSIKQEILERGKASELKSNLLNDELTDAKFRIQSLEKALISAREAIRVLQGGGANSSMIQVNNPSRFSTNSGRVQPSNLSSNQFDQRNRRQSLPEYNPVRPRTLLPSNNPVRTNIQNDSIGGANLQIEARVQFLDNKVRPAGFTEFFLVDRDLSEILAEEGINPPLNQGIQTHSEYWARSVQRGYQFPGVAAKIRNVLARLSLRRIKTNSLGVGNVDDLGDGDYYIIGSSTLGQVGVVWSKPISLNQGDNKISLDLNDASWAQ
jgi:chromosome segregation ATPase